MATLVGTQKTVVDMMEALLELEYDAIEAYEAAVERISDAADKGALGGFLTDHRRHVSDLTPIIARLGGDAARGPDMKRWLTKGKVVIMGLAGDNAILFAMKTNEEDTNTSYERAVSRDDVPEDVRAVLERNLADERRHRAWIEARLASPQPTAAGPGFSPAH